MDKYLLYACFVAGAQELGVLLGGPGFSWATPTHTPMHLFPQAGPLTLGNWLTHGLGADCPAGMPVPSSASNMDFQAGTEQSDLTYIFGRRRNGFTHGSWALPKGGVPSLS